MIRDAAALHEALGYTFNDPKLLEAALTHRSAAGRHNERLEFLGDAVLALSIAQVLFESLPRAREGELTRLRAALVKRDTLAEIAAEIELGNYLRLGPGELKSGGFRRESILADALEALIGAIFVESGLDAADRCIRRLFGTRLESLPDGDALKDPKTRLQEHLQGCQLPLPEYVVEHVHGEPHALTFTVRCRVDALGLSEQGIASSRRRAEQEAARRALSRIASG